MVPIVVFASGRGSNFDSIQRAIEEKKLNARILAVISDKKDALVLSKAEKAGIVSLHVAAPVSSTQSVLERRMAHEKKILEEIQKLKPQFLVLAGYMRILTSEFINEFRSEKGYVRIVNIHPSLLPSFPGTDAYAQAFRYGAKVSGVTVHFVEPKVDSGPICAQEVFSIEDCHTVGEVEKRGLEIEHRLYPQTLSWVLTEKFEIERRSEGRFYVRQN